MTHSHILGPPRTGRKVLTEQQCLEELAEYNANKNIKPKPGDNPPRRSSRKKNLAKPSLIPNGASNPHPYFIAPGRFKVGSFAELGDFFVFHDLELPMGSWEKLLLTKTLPSMEKTQYQWRKETQRRQPEGVIPLDILYGLGVVCYLNRESYALPNVICESIFRRDSKGDIPYNATYFSLGAKGDDLITTGDGWPLDHPFSSQYIADTSQGKGLSIAPPLPPNKKLVDIALNVLGEIDLERCREVIGWMTEGVSPLFSYSWDVSEPQAVSAPRIARSSNLYGCLYLRQSFQQKRKARFIEADPKYFTKK